MKNVEILQGEFPIFIIKNPTDRSALNKLIAERYTWRGYGPAALPTEDPSRITLAVKRENELRGTLTIQLDGPAGLSADALFLAELDAIRGSGHSVCEFGKLAMLSNSETGALKALYNTAFNIARALGVDYLLIEVNPRHVRYYERIFGFDAISEPALNERVNAPAVLMRLSLQKPTTKIPTIPIDATDIADHQNYLLAKSNSTLTSKNPSSGVHPGV